MKSICFLMLLMCTTCLVQAQTKKTYKINGFEYYTLEKTEAEEGVSSTAWIELYRMENGKSKYLLKHITNYSEEDHSGSAKMLGKMLIKGNHIVFYSYWAWAGDMPIHPFGGRKQTYQVNNKGELLKGPSQLYVENIRETYIPQMLKILKAGGEDTKGVKGQVFLHKTPKNDAEKKLFAEYIKEVETIYHADFVFGKASDRLMKEVRTQFNTEIVKLKKEWQEVHGKFGRWIKM